MSKLHIFAVEEDLIFDRGYAGNMKLPFNKGWSSWRVFQEAAYGLIHLQDFPTYREAVKFIEENRNASREQSIN